MKLRLNREFAVRHLFACVVFLLLGGWFALDGFVRYPATPAADLYRMIEGEGVPLKPAAELEAFKAQKVAIQRAFSLAGFLAGAVVGLRLLARARFAFAFDDDGFTCAGVRRAYDAIETVDASAWERKSIVTIAGKGWRIALDAWHHTGVKEFFEKIKDRG